MANLFSKIKRTLDEMKNTYKDNKLFSSDLARTNLKFRICTLMRARKKADEYTKRKHSIVSAYIEDVCADIIEKYRNDSFQGEKTENAPIWICWWTGEETAPQIVKQCIKSIRKNAGTHPVILINQYNYSDYLDIPDYILDKVEDKRMCVANFSDYLRVSLLGKYGGYWIDATIFISREIPEEYFDRPFFTCKYYTPNSSWVSASRWTPFCMSGWKDNVFFRFVKEAFETYWQSHEKSIDYLILDYIIVTAYNHIQTFKECIDTLENNNAHRNDLARAMVEGREAEKFDSFIAEDTVFYKLSWREKYPLKTVDGKQSVYSYFLEKEI